jgi:iron complex outermembrane receptor protein
MLRATVAGCFRPRRWTRWLLVSSTLAVGVGLAALPAAAQTEAEERPAATEEAEPTDEDAVDPGRRGPTPGADVIVVTPDFLMATEFDAPVSVTSFQAADLVALGVEDVSGIAAFTPNLEIRNAGATSSTFFIRGVGLNDFTANAAGAVAIYQDDVALNLPAIQLGQLFDVREVEVLRGPQGSGRGRNASAGAIKIHAVKPTGEYAAFLRGEAGRYDSRLLEGALEVPIVEDVLSTRVAFLAQERDPFVRNGCANAPPRGLARVNNPNRQLQTYQVCGETFRETIENPDQQPGQPPRYAVSALAEGLPEKMNDLDNWAARAQLRLVPPDTGMDWLLNVHGSKVDQQATVGQAIGTTGYFGGSSAGYRQPEIVAEEEAILASLGGGPSLRPEARRILAKNLAERLDWEPYRGDYNRAGFERQESIGGFLRGDFEFDAARLTSISAYERYVREREVDGDYTPNIIFESEVEDDGWQITQDLGFEGDLAGGTVLWNAGGYYLMDHLDFVSDTITGPGLSDLVREFEQESYSFGLYAGATWDLLDDFTLETGARYNWEQKNFEVDLRRSNSPICDIRDCEESDTWQAPTGEVSLRYRFLEDMSAYVKYARGWKGAQYNAGGASGDTITLADPETIDAWETGISGTWYDGLITAKGSLFYYSYEDYQVFITQNDRDSPPQRIVVNANDAQLYGAEIEGSILPIDILFPRSLFEGLRFAGRFGWLEGEFLDFTNAVFQPIDTPGPAPPVIVPVTIDYTGNRMPNTPRYKLSLTAEWTLGLGRFGWLVPRYDYTWTDDVFFDPSDGRGLPNTDGETFMPEYAIGQKAYGLHNARLAWRTPDEQIEIAVWVRNIEDEIYKTLAFDASGNANLVGYLVGDPRTYGVGASIRF